MKREKQFPSKKSQSQDKLLFIFYFYFLPFSLYFYFCCEIRERANEPLRPATGAPPPHIDKRPRPNSPHRHLLLRHQKPGIRTYYSWSCQKFLPLLPKRTWYFIQNKKTLALYFSTRKLVLNLNNNNIS